MSNSPISEHVIAEERKTTATGLLRLRPGALVFEVSADRLQVSFANHTATFTSPPVTKGVRALLKVLECPGERGEVVRQAAEMTNLESEFIDYLVQQLIQTNCLYVTTTPLSDALPGAMEEFYASLGVDPAAMLGTLAAFRPLIVTPANCAQDLTKVFKDGEINADLVVLPAGITCADGLAQVRSRLETKPRIIISWNFPYRLPFARFLNDLSIERKIPILFGVCEGMVGRIGPYVIPQNTPCLECLNRRVLTHAGSHEMQVFAEYRIRYQDSIPPARPTHPVFQDAIARLLALELSRIALNFPPNTLGGVIEYSYADGSAQRHPIYKVPRCEACYATKPQRISWDARFTTPVSKDGAE